MKVISIRDIERDVDYLEVPHGIPDESAFRRVPQCLNPRQLQEGLENWFMNIKIRNKEAGTAGRIQSIRNDTGERFHEVSMWIGSMD
ncbi:MAG: transposase family protein [Treponema sp.]|nr:transposase family protein [Treponema sp.]